MRRGAFTLLDISTAPLEKGNLALRGAVVHGGVGEPGAVVAWQFERDGPMRGGSISTGGDGNFEIDGLAPGRMILGVAAPGFGIEFVQVAVTEADSGTRAIELQPASALHLRLPASMRPQQVGFRVSGWDVTQMLWRLPNGAPT